MPPHTVFVAGATGTVGGAVIQSLLGQSFAIQALARNGDSVAARKLVALGVRVFHGGYDDEKVLESAVSGCDSVFLNLTPDFVDHSWELRIAKQIMDVAKKAEVKKFIYSSGFAVNEPQRLKHWDPNGMVPAFLLSKQAIENELRVAGFQYWTILRPGNFMANYLLPLAAAFPELIQSGRFVTALTPDVRLPTIDPNDIGKFAAAAFMAPSKFHSKELEIAGELLGVEDILEKLSRVSGKKLKAIYLSEAEVNAQKAANPFLAGQLLMRDMNKFVDMEEVKLWGIQFGTFDEYLEREKARVDETYSKVS